ncbi:nickel pincer cofactor biosynthesis protein LarB [Pseudactinotalea sp. HY160]|uniref:nickel pincer cofactor biosynthesis protein LarB n=1 Tax=Pseudactinotalea sp. HY160 TaxID=2654490 RepID=UPI0013137746|nr:nickel pincer cofactor biosynthesis protein LarB [Pseudactinotalea sp. HY160]
MPDRPTPEWAPGPEFEQVRLDLERGRRRGYPEAVLCEPKSTEQVALVAARVAAAGTPTLFTRVRPEQVEAIRAALPEAAHHEQARLVAWPARPPAPTGGSVLVLSAGTSDVPVALEAQLTARHLGREASLLADVGVAGLHRLLAQVDRLREASAIVVAAGMDGALPGVVAGLVSAPVIAVPTSVGYGAAFAGLAPLLTMLNACAPGVAVVNIDNGYGAGHLAAQISADRTPVATPGNR